MKADQEFECLGYFEEIVDARKHKLLGTRPVAKPDRPLGAAGQIELKITAPITLKRWDVRPKTYRASAAKPIFANATLQIKCGRLLKHGRKKAILAGDMKQLHQAGTSGIY